MAYKTLFFTTFILVILLLASPIIFFKIGPEGYKFYGTDVPDIYIFGASIFGKDRSWWGINFAYKFQLGMICLYFLFSVWAYIRYQQGQKSFFLLLINLVLLLLFPVWLFLYISGVVNNSDGADLSIHPHVGVGIYCLLFCLNSGLLCVMYRNRLKIKS